MCTVQAVIERGSLVGTAGPVWAVYVCSAGPRCAQHVWHGDASVDGDNVMAMCVCMLWSCVHAVIECGRHGRGLCGHRCRGMRDACVQCRHQVAW